MGPNYSCLVAKLLPPLSYVDRLLYDLQYKGEYYRPLGRTSEDTFLYESMTSRKVKIIYCQHVLKKEGKHKEAGLCESCCESILDKKKALHEWNNKN